MPCSIAIITTGKLTNFDKRPAEEITSQGLPYDYDSIMHYDAYAFSSNDLPTITPVYNTIPIGRLGQRERLSQTDKEHIKKMYPKSKWLMLYYTYKLVGTAHFSY